MLRLTGFSGTPMSARVRHADASDPFDARALGTLHSEATAERLTHRGGAVLVGAVLRGSDPHEVARSFARHAGSEDVEVLVAEFLAGPARPGDAAVPLGHAVIRFPNRGEQPVAVIEELYVTPAARNVGLGSALLDRAKAAAAARGCTGLDAVALPGDRSTKNFFEDHSMVARAIIVHTELAP